MARKRNEIMKDWKISVEESKALMDKDIFVLKNNGRKLYCRTVLSEDKTRLEMVPLSKEELAKLGIVVEESYSSEIDAFDVTVEESEGEPEKKPIGKGTLDLNDPKDAELAAQIANRQLEKLKKEDPEKWGASKPETRTEMLKNKTPEDLAIENEDLKEKLTIMGEKELERKKKEAGCSDPDINTKEKLDAWSLGKKSSQGEGGAPNARPDSLRQVGPISQQQGYETPEQMIDDLRRRARSGEREGKLILDELMRKYVRGMRDSEAFQVKYPRTPEPSESKGETVVKVIGQGTGSDPNQESELAKWLRKGKRSE